jgi:uncharacterized protein YidB (DUF937 family)
MFEQIVNDLASRFSIGTAAVSSLIRGLLALLTNERTGGMVGFLDLFRKAGLEDVAQSWLGDGTRSRSSQIRLNRHSVSKPWTGWHRLQD